MIISCQRVLLVKASTLDRVIALRYQGRIYPLKNLYISTKYVAKLFRFNILMKLIFQSFDITVIYILTGPADQFHI